MTKKITSTLLRECAEKYESDASYTWQNVEEDLGVEEDVGWDTSRAFRTIAESIEEHYIELPVDNRGEPIHIGDSIYCALDDYAEPHKVWGVELGASPFVDASVGVLLDGEDIPRWVAADHTFHDKPDSWERIIRDATTAGYAYLGDTEEDSAFDKLTAEKRELVARCRKLAGETDE